MNESKGYVEMLAQVSPGTPLREGIDNILDAGFGALIVVGYDETVQKMIDGGFFIGCEYTPERLFELAKMDGAIILDDNCTRIINANVHLQVNRSYMSEESGTRHRTAERAGEESGKLVIAVSERKKIVSLYKGKLKCKLKTLSDLVEEATQTIDTLEKYKSVLNKALSNLTILELEGLVTLDDVAMVLQRFEMLRRREKELKDYILELGSEGRLINFQNEELMQGIEEEERDFLNDYMDESMEYDDIYEIMSKIEDNQLFDKNQYLNALGYGKNADLDKEAIPKGYRVLGKINKLTGKDIEKLVAEYDNLSDIQEASQEDLANIKISKFKIKAMKNGLQRLKSTIELEK